jgi:hypothetical protein
VPCDANGKLRQCDRQLTQFQGQCPGGPLCQTSRQDREQVGGRYEFGNREEAGHSAREVPSMPRRFKRFIDKARCIVLRKNRYMLGFGEFIDGQAALTSGFPRRAIQTFDS